MWWKKRSSLLNVGFNSGLSLGPVAVHKAARGGHPDAIKALEDAGANVLLRTFIGVGNELVMLSFRDAMSLTEPHAKTDV